MIYTKKHFIDLAEMLNIAYKKGNTDTFTLKCIKQLLINRFKNDNPNFDVERFEKAVDF